MREFARPSSLARLSFEARLVYSGFCVFLLAGSATSVWLYQNDGLSVETAAVRVYYLGDGEAAVAQSPQPSDDAAGPALDLPYEAAQEPLRMAKSPRQVMETFHFHLFSMAVCLLVVAHLFMMCGVTSRIKAWVIGTGFVSTWAHAVTPPLIRLVAPGWAVLMFPSAVLMGVSWLAMTAWPLVEMWVLLPRRRA